MVGKILIEHIARIPVEVDIASEFRYRDPIVDENTVVLAISQSGETADTLAAMEEGAAERRHAMVDRQCDRLAGHAHGRWLYLHAERARRSAWPPPRPSPPRWSTCICWPSCWAICAARSIESSPPPRWSATCAWSPTWSGAAWTGRPKWSRWPGALKDTSHCLYLGRGINMPIAYEGALKLKEISYIHAEGYPAGEMKHGPIALIDRRCRWS